MLLPAHAKVHHRGLDMPQCPQGTRRVVRCGRGHLFGGLHGVETRRDAHVRFSDLTESLCPPLRSSFSSRNGHTRRNGYHPRDLMDTKMAIDTPGARIGAVSSEIWGPCAF